MRPTILMAGITQQRASPRPGTAEPTSQPALPLASSLRWLVGIRLVVITSLALPYFLYRLTQSDLPSQLDFLYLLSGLVYGASLVYIALLRWLAGRPEIQAYIQFIGDLLMITGLVYYFGGLASPFSIFYFVVVIVAAALLGRRSALAIGTLAWVLYASTVLALAFHLLTLPGGLPAETPGRVQLIYNLGVHLLGFIAVAMLSSRLAQSVVRAETELRRKGEQVADLEVFNRDVIESIPSGLVTTDQEGRVTSANRAAEEILGIDATDLGGSPIFELGFLSPEQWQSLVSNESPEYRTRRELVYTRGDIHHFIGYALTQLTSAEGTPSGYILIFQDLTDWRQLQDELRLKDRMAAVGELAAGIAHEIGNPLAAISGSVQMLAGSYEGQPAQSRLLEITLKESQRLDRTIKSFLKFARPKERSSVRFDVAELLAENLKLLRHSSEVAENHWLELELDPTSVSLVADPDQISQIFWNLARNALRAMPDGGTLTIVGQQANSNYRISFADTGRGMDDDERARLFHPFKSFFDGGTGIGMAIVYRIVEEHGGRLTVESEPGTGSTIAVELPLPDDAATEPQP
ncbi:MAG: ATP-binding protein [Thermoanaerobaculia bacterium]